MTWVAVAIGGAAVVGGAVGIYASNNASSASSNAANMQSESTREATKIQADTQKQIEEMQLAFLREQRADIAKAVESGLVDLQTGFDAAVSQLQPSANLGAIGDYQNLISNPESVMERPAVKAQFDQGIEALNAAFSRSLGGGTSGPAIKAAIEYGQNFASKALDLELSRIAPLVDIESNANTNIANILINKGTSMANLKLAGATGSASATQAASTNIANSMTNSGNATAASIARLGDIGAENEINQANIGSWQASNISSQASNLAMLYATNPGLFSTTKNTTVPKTYRV